MKLLSVLIAAVLLLGCNPQARVEYVYQEVSVPVPYRPAPPAWLAEPYSPEALPEFLPFKEGVGLDQEGITHLKTILRTLVTRDEAWRQWSTEDE